MKSKVESGYHAEVAAPSAEPPQQLRVLVGARVHDGSVGSYELGADDVVAGEAVLRGQVSDTTPEREAGYAGRADNAARGDEPERLRCRV